MGENQPSTQNGFSEYKNLILSDLQAIKHTQEVHHQEEDRRYENLHTRMSEMENKVNNKIESMETNFKNDLAPLNNKIDTLSVAFASFKAKIDVKSGIWGVAGGGLSLLLLYLVGFIK